MWYKLPSKAAFLLIWCFATIVVIYGPWGGDPEPGKFSWVAISSGATLILTPLLAIFLSGGSKEKETIIDQDKNQNL
ncbi:hypothetical protein [Neobacillus sp. 114]|uniref:hypothetical protein n=1 Tax=Neobacillus sp. 114 TaxID=3048535 RepID=UPI0024C29495|nr:hypothetical protein [Neobacillus sp. 114]